MNRPGKRGESRPATGCHPSSIISTTFLAATVELLENHLEYDNLLTSRKPRFLVLQRRTGPGMSCGPAALPKTPVTPLRHFSRTHVSAPPADTYAQRPPRLPRCLAALACYLQARSSLLSRQRGESPKREILGNLAHGCVWRAPAGNEIPAASRCEIRSHSVAG